MTKTADKTKKKKELSEFELFDSMRQSGALGGTGFSAGSTGALSSKFGTSYGTGAGLAPTAHTATRPVKHRTTEPLTSRNFANLMDALDTAGAHDLKYLKMSEYLTKTGKLLDIPMPKLQLGYSDKAECATDRVNFPVMASIYESVAQVEVQEYAQQLAAIPALTKDMDYQDAASAMFRAVGARQRVQEQFPGFTEAWGDFFEEMFAPAFKTFPNLTDDPNRKVLFEAMSSIVQGKVTTPELREHETLIEQASELFRTASVQEFGDALYAISVVLTETPPPEPPSDGDGDGENDDDNQADSTDPQDPNDGQGEGEGQGEGQNEGENNQENNDQDADPFSQLAQYMRNADPENMPEMEDLKLSEQLEAPQVDFDPEGLGELLELQADVTIPDSGPALHSVYFRAPAPPEAGTAWNILKSTYQQQVMEVTRLIDEFYRIKTLNERGLLSGRADGGRLYKVNFGARDVFKRSFVDSVGHMSMIVLLDESGSMSRNVQEFKLPRKEVLQDLKIHDARYAGESVLTGKALPGFDTNRANLSRLMGFLMVEASKSLDGFNVEVAGYTGVNPGSLPTKLRPIGQAVIDMIQKEGGHTWGVPTVRFLGDKKAPLGIMTSTAISDNADLQALAWAIEKLEKDSADQKCIVFAADGCVSDEHKLMPKLLARAKKANIYIHFMDMSEGDIPDDSPLNTLPKTEVNCFKTMMHGLTSVLQAVTRDYL